MLLSMNPAYCMFQMGKPTHKDYTPSFHVTDYSCASFHFSNSSNDGRGMVNGNTTVRE